MAYLAIICSVWKQGKVAGINNLTRNICLLCFIVTSRCLYWFSQGQCKSFMQGPEKGMLLYTMCVRAAVGGEIYHWLKEGYFFPRNFYIVIWYILCSTLHGNYWEEPVYNKEDWNNRKRCPNIILSFHITSIVVDVFLQQVPDVMG